MFNVYYLKAVEAYAYHENKWSYFPSMLTARSNHTDVSINNKMFVVGGFSKSVFSSCEDLDSVARKFTSFKILQHWTRNLNARQTVSVGYNIYFFCRR